MNHFVRDVCASDLDSFWKDKSKLGCKVVLGLWGGLVPGSLNTPGSDRLTRAQLTMQQAKTPPNLYLNYFLTEETD